MLDPSKDAYISQIGDMWANSDLEGGVMNDVNQANVGPYRLEDEVIDQPVGCSDGFDILDTLISH